MTKKELIELISNETEISKKDVTKCLDKFADIIIDRNSKGEMVDFSNLGKFVILKKNATQARNPRTGETIEIKEHYVPKFKAKSSFKQIIKESKIDQN